MRPRWHWTRNLVTSGNGRRGRRQVCWPHHPVPTSPITGVHQSVNHRTKLAHHHKGILVFDTSRLPIGKIPNKLVIGKILSCLIQQRIRTPGPIIINNLSWVLLRHKLNIIIKLLGHMQQQTLGVHGNTSCKGILGGEKAYSNAKRT